ncbi:MAG TPA: NAD(P)(+) transhydrogenase (Re/Si-specific) subunit alpha, partial [Blastocatellia bacterium]
MRIAVLRERLANESRVALVPESVRKLVGLKATVSVESDAGQGAGASDDAYRAAGAEVTSDRAALLDSADVLVSVNRPSEDDLARLKSGAVVLGFLRPLDEPEAIGPIIARGLTAFAMELVPRTTRAQSMDALSSMATVVGYKAVLLAASNLPRMFPMLTTAAGTVPPARVLVLGAGVAGLQAIATARRLGAVVEGFDIRAAAGEAVRSLGATFLEVDLTGIQTEDAGGYAKELTEEAMNRSRAAIARQARAADCVITSAQVPGKAAP